MVLSAINSSAFLQPSTLSEILEFPQNNNHKIEATNTVISLRSLATMLLMICQTVLNLYKILETILSHGRSSTMDHTSHFQPVFCFLCLTCSFLCFVLQTEYLFCLTDAYVNPSYFNKILFSGISLFTQCPISAKYR